MTEMPFINNSEGYGVACPVTVEDYLDLNPDGRFETWGDEIREYRSDEPGDYEVVARRAGTQPTEYSSLLTTAQGAKYLGCSIITIKRATSSTNPALKPDFRPTPHLMLFTRFTLDRWWSAKNHRAGRPPKAHPQDTE